MQEYNYFDLLRLSPFPKLPQKDEILTAIEKWRTETTKKANSSGTPQDQKSELQDMLRSLPAKMTAFASDQAAQNEQKIQYKNAHCAQLQIVAESMKKFSGTSIREATLRRIARQTGLLPEDVKGIFKTSGFNVLPSVQLTSNLPDSKLLTTFFNNLEQLKKALARGIGHVPAEIGSIQDLYGYLKLMLEYEGLDPISMNDWKAIQGKFSDLSVRHATGTEPYNFYRNIESMAKTGMFASESNKSKYDRYLKLQESGLASAMEAIAGLPESVRTDPIFAKDWVSGIQRELGVEEEEAYDIYNLCCRIPPEERLEKEDIQIQTLCSCGYLNTHKSLDEAKAAACPICKKKLYVPCPSCGKPVRNSADHCPSCGYYLSGEQIFHQAVEACKSAIARRQIQEARRYLERAREHKLQNYSLQELESQLNILETSIGKSLGQIDQLILNGKLNEATREIQNLKADNPGIDLTVQMRNLQQKRQMIDSQRRNLDAKMQGIDRLSIQDQVRICMETLSQDENYEPALQRLKNPALAPLPVPQVRAVQNDSNSTVTVSWTPNPQNTYVTYSVIRMTAKTVPSSPQDGLLLASQLETNSFIDKQTKPGQIYFYAVFAVRKNYAQWSKATITANPVALMPGCSAFSFTIADRDCVLQWTPPTGCAGVRIERSSGQSGQWEVIQPQIVTRSYTDRNLRLDANYRYRCTPIWNINGSVYVSPLPSIISVQLQKKPSPVSLSLTQQENGLYGVSWQTTNQGTMEIWAVPASRRMSEGTVVEASTLSEIAKKLWQGAAAARTATFTIPAGQEIQLFSACGYGTQVVIGEPLFVTTMGALAVEWDQLKLSDDTLSLPIDSKEGITEIRVFLDQEKPDREYILRNNPFASVKLSQGVRESQIIQIPHLPQRELWVAVVGIFKNGAITLPSSYLVNNLPRLPVTYAVNWKKSGMFRSSISGLEITVRVRERHTPHVLLVTNRKNATIPLRENEYADDRMNILLDIAEGTSPETHGRVPETAIRALPPGARIKLILAPDVQSGYRAPVPENAMLLTMPN